VYENPYYIYNISNLNKILLNNSPKCNVPHVQFDKGSSDLSIMIPTTSSSDESEPLSLKFKIYSEDSTIVPDYTTVDDLNVDDIVHVYGFELDETYILESYITSDSTNISQSELKKESFKTATGVCSTPIVIRDSEYGE
jgi:hypothetical protein